MDRKNFIKSVKRAFKSHPIVAILGPRQCGKTTLADKINVIGLQSYLSPL